MSLTNAERQRRFRQRRKEADRVIDRIEAITGHHCIDSDFAKLRSIKELVKAYREGRKIGL